MSDTPPPLSPPGASKGAGAQAPAIAPGRKRRRTRWRWWFLLFVAGLATLAFSPEPWHFALRTLLTWRAERLGWDLQIGALEGGLFDSTQLYAIRCHERSGKTARPPNTPARTDFQIGRAELVLAWRWPWLQRPESSWVRRLTLDGLRGTVDLTPTSAAKRTATVWEIATSRGWQAAVQSVAARLRERGNRELARQLGRLDRRWVPAALGVNGEDFTLQRNRYHLRAQRLRLTAAQDEAGSLYVRQLEVSSPEFASTLQEITGWTYCKGNSLTLGDIDLGRDVHLASATLQMEHLDRRQLGWEGELRALGGSARGQGAINLARPRLALEIAGSLEKMAVLPLAKLLGVSADGEVQQANFTFRGDPENWTAAQMWLAADATDFRWGQRRWESLNLRGVVVNRRIQVHQLELRQSRNQLSFTGECGLPAAGEAAVVPLPALPALAATAWWQAGFSCTIDARVDDLQALALLAGGQLPALSGRMSVNGTLSANPGAPGIDGYLNVEGSALSIRGAPLDSLRTTVLFQGVEANIPDLQATRGGDYLSGKGTLQIIGPARYRAELHAAIKDLAVYAPAYVDLSFSPKPVSGSLNLDWSGDGAPGASSGVFQGRTERFFTVSGPAALARPIDLSADGTYSPESVSFRHLILKEGPADKRRDALKLEGALPWTRDPKALTEGRWLDPERAMSVRVVFAEAPLDLLAALAPGWVLGAEGLVNGWLNADGTLQAPKLDADIQLLNASFRPAAPGAAALENVNGRVRLEKSLLGIDQLKGRWGAQTLDVTGGMDLSDTTKVGSDFSFRGIDADGVHNGALDAELSYVLTLKGPPGLLGGEINLLSGRYQRELAIGADAPLAGDWLDLAARLPLAWREQPIDLHLTAAPALRIAGGGKDAEIVPDLQFTGTPAAPRMSGTVEIRQAPVRGAGEWLGVGTGTWYFSSDQPGNPVVSVSARDQAGEESVFVGPALGPLDVSLSSTPEQWEEPDALAAFGRDEGRL